MTTSTYMAALAALDEAQGKKSARYLFRRWVINRPRSMQRQKQPLLYHGQTL